MLVPVPNFFKLICYEISILQAHFQQIIMKNRFILPGLCVIFVTSFTNTKAQTMSTDLLAPKAKVIPKSLEKHKDIRIDNYFWMNERENPEVIDYLNQENAYYNSMTAHTKDFQKDLFEEIGRAHV